MYDPKVKQFVKCFSKFCGLLTISELYGYLGMGANAITGLRMETNTIFDGTVDMVLYGTAVHVNR